MVPSCRVLLRQLFISVLIAGFCTGIIFILVTSRIYSFHHVEETGSDVVSLTVIASKNRTCVPADDPVDVDSDRKVCRPLIEGAPIPLGRPLIKPLLTPSMTKDYIQLAATDCDCFRSRLSYYTAADTTDEERAFPLAFSLLTYENLEQTERLLRLVYRPHNVYCIHVDWKATPEMHHGMETVAACLPNVLVARPAINVTWGEITVVQAELMCMGYLLAHSSVQWKYFINLVARDMPLRTNEELVKILKAYNGANDIAGTRQYHFYTDWFEYRWKHYRRIKHSMKTYERKPPPPHGYNITKGSAHIAVTREFVQHVLTDRKARDLLDWMSDIRVPDEHFFQTLNHNPHNPAPGSFPGDPDSKMTNTRAKRWLTAPSPSCAGWWVREVCNVQLGDLPWVVASPEMFLNKIRLGDGRTTFRCLELWYRDRVARRHLANKSTSSSSLADLGYRFNVTYYSQQPLVQLRRLIPTAVPNRNLTSNTNSTLGNNNATF